MNHLAKKRGIILALGMAVMLVPGMRMDAMEDAYRKPSLSGTVKTWVYQGDTYEESRNRVFADDQEDGDLTTELVKTGNIDTSVLGEQTISYEVTDVDGNTVQMETVVLVLERDNDGSEGEKNIQRKLYTLPEASHLTDIGFDRGYYHDRQNLGIWLPADTEMKVRLVNHEEFNRNLELGFMNDDSYTESSASIPSSGEWVTVKNSFREDGAEKSKDSVPFIKTPKDISVQPIVEIEWKEELEELPYYRYGDDENTFFRKWDDSQAPFAVIEGEAATFLVPILDRDNIINRITNQGDRDVYSFTSIDGMLEWYGEFVEQYDRYSGLKFYPGEAEPYNQNVRAKFFIKANKHGAGAAYYSQDHSASNSESMEGYLVKNWLSLHEFGHGYEGAIAKREHPFVETTNNIMGYYFEQTYREGDLGWMLGYAPIEQKAQKFAELGESAENRRNPKTTFMGIIDGAWNYGESLFMFVNVLDKLGPENTVSAMHTQYRKYYYENKMHTSSSDVIIDSFSRAGGYNVIPYFEGWHVEPSKQKESQIYDMDLPMVYYLKNLIADEEKCEEIRENLGLNGIYSLVSTDDLADTGYKSKVEFQISIDNIAQIQNRNILIKNGEKIVKEVCVTGETISVELPVGIYEVELPAPRASVYQYGNEYLAASEGNVSKTFSYSRIEGNPVGDDMGFRLTGFDDVEIAAISVNSASEKLNLRINHVSPHVYYDTSYIKIKAMDPKGNVIFNKDMIGNVTMEEEVGDYSFPVGSTLEIYHAEPSGRLKLVSGYDNREDRFKAYGAASGEEKTITYVLTEKGLMKSGWDEEEQMDAYLSVLKSYSEAMIENMSQSDMADAGKYHNEKLIVSAAYDFLNEEAKEKYNASYGMLVGMEPEAYMRYAKVDSSKMDGFADSEQDKDDNAAENALDGDENTIWHTRWTGEGVYANPAEEENNTYTILLDENMDIGKLEYVPRTGGSDNGRILSYRIFYSITENRDDFQEVSLENCTWANNKDVKSVEFDAPGARRIRIAALSTAGDAEDQKNKFISAAEFRLYEKYKISVKNTYLTDMYMDTSDQSVQRNLNGNGQVISLSVNERKKTFAKGVGMAAGSTVSWDLEGKGFDTVTAWAGVDAGQTGEVQAVVEIYGDGNLLYRSETLEGGGLAEPVRLDIAGVKKLEIKTIQVKGKAYVSLADAKLINNGDKQEITLTVGESATVSDNKALMPQDKGKVMWSSSDSSVALVSEDGIITAAGKGDTVITAKYPQQTFTCTVHVQELSEEAKQALVQRKTDAETALETYKNAEDYREAQKLELAQAIADGKAAIEKAADSGDVNAALAAAKAVLDKIKTDAQLTQEENQGGTVTPPDKDPGEDVAPPDKKPGENVTPPVKNPEPVLPKVGSTVEYGKFMYKILTSGSSGGTAAVVKPKKNTDKQIVVPDTIEVKGYVYRVTEISAKAFGKCKKLVQATVGKNVTKIGKQAFAGCKKLKKIIIKSTKIKSIGKKAFSKINKRAKIRVPKKKLKNYKKLLKKSKIVKSVKVTK